jgi:EpsI family protein
MASDKSVFKFLNCRPVQAAAVLLLLQAGLFYGLPKERPVNLAMPLTGLPAQLGEWQKVSEIPIEKNTLDVLRADDTLSRVYVQTGSNRGVNLFVAFFRSQTTGVAPHSPKNCLPGAGWSASRADTLRVPLPGTAGSVEVNRYVISKGDAKSLVLYWYQSHNRAVASEYAAKIYLVADSIRYRRSDTSIVRVTTPISNNDEEGAQRAAVDFVAASFATINDLLPR